MPNRKRRKKTPSVKNIFFALGLFVFAILGLLLLLQIYLINLPKVSTLDSCFTSSLHKIEICSSKSNYTKLKDVPKYFIDALIISEDSSFFSHNGFDWYELKNSLEQNWERGYYYRGASTISQQLIKNAFLSDEKTILRKISEAYLTYELEKNYSKSFILEKYLNIVELGPKIYGISKAAQFYFNKHPSELNLLEASFLVHLLPNPVSYSKGFLKKELSVWNHKRMKQILKKMSLFGKINRTTYDSAIYELAYFPFDSVPENLQNVDESLEETDSLDDSENLDMPSQEEEGEYEEVQP